MRKSIDLPDNVIENLGKEAKEQKRSLKGHMEYALIMQSNAYTIGQALKEKNKTALKQILNK